VKLILSFFFAAALWAEPRILIIGDSISMGYTPFVTKMMAGQAYVEHSVGNGGPTISGVAHIQEWLKDGNWDVIHFNFGLHDLKIMENGKHQVSLEDYEKNLGIIIAAMRKTKAKLVFATTTPVPEGKQNPVRLTADVLKFNAVALRVMEQNKIAVDDLYDVAMKRIKEIQRPNNVHFTDPGYEELAKPVVESIWKQLR